MFKAIDSKIIGGILMIVGTSVGAGMLALPVNNAQTGFIDSTIFLVLSWLTMTLGAFLILEVNLWFPRGSNLISMAQATLGKWGKALTWLVYLFLFYTLLSAYLSEGADVLMNSLHIFGLNIPMWVAALLVVGLLGTVVFHGIRSVDMVNRGLMFGKLGIYVLLVFLIAPHVSLPNLRGGEMRYITSAIMLIITSFGFANLVPTLREYFDDDVKKLRKVLIIGSLIPLFCYIAWNMVIMGVIPREGQQGLIEILDTGRSTVGLTHSLENLTHSGWITHFFQFFTSICMLTAFLGVAIALTDFMADGLKLEKSGKQGVYLSLAVFGPPLLIVLISPGLFIKALSLAGIFCVLLLLLIPIMMAWRGRYVMNMAQGYQVLGGKFSLILGASAAVLLLLAAFI